MAVQDYFVWGSGGQKLTPGELARRREVEDAILARGVDTSPVGHWTQGAARVADAIAGAFRRGQVAKGEKEIANVNKGLISSLLAGGSSAASPTSASAIPMSGAAGEVAATSPSAQPIDLSGNEVYSQFINTAREGGLTNPYGLAALAATGKAESGFDPGNVNRTWSDPSQSGQPGTAGGILSWRGPRYQALAATGDLSPAGQARFFLQEDPGLVQALNKAGSVEEAQSLINNAWKFAGYDRADGETARRLGLARSFLQTFQGGGEVAAATPEAAIEAIAPLQPVERGPLPASSYAGQERMPPQSLSEEVAAYQQTPEYAAAFPGRQQPVAATQPVQVAGGGDRVPMASASTGINPAIIEALTNPQASEQTQRIAGILLQQDQARQNAAMDEQNWRARQAYEQELQANDPVRKLQLEKGQLEIDALRNPQPKETDDIREYNFAVQQGFQGSFADFQQQMRKAGATSVNVGGGENRQVFDAVAESANSARSAVTGLNALSEARRAVEGGIISGAGADARLGLQRVGALLGVADPGIIQNTETFRSAIAPQVAAMMKATVGSTQISNSDREFAQQAAGGSINLNEGTIKRLLGIMERAGQVAVRSHMDRLNKVYPEGQGFDRERALFGVDLPEMIPTTPAQKSVDEMSDEELRAIIDGR